jgi:trehalose/maltose hydrolase-like predicted phosphorylase
VALPQALDRRFEAFLFDWDGTAVPDRRASAVPLRERLEALCALGAHAVIVSGTNLENVDGQLRARPSGPGRLYLCLNRGSEVFRVGEGGPRLVHRREATPEEDGALTRAAAIALERLAARGLHAEVVSARLNRRKIDLIPEPEWADPPKARIAELVEAVEDRLARTGIRGLAEAADIALGAAGEAGLAGARVTSDAKHVEIGLTDKSDSARFAFRELWRLGVGPSLVLLAGDELGPLGGLPGSDSLLLVPEGAGAVAVSVGLEPEGVPEEVVWLGGGPATFHSLLDDQLGRRERHEVPEIHADPRWTVAVDGLDPELERVHEALLTLADGTVGTSGSPLLAHPAATPGVVALGLYQGEGPETTLAPLPDWSRLAVALRPDASLRRVLDLRAGLLREELIQAGGLLRAMRFSSLARPGTVGLRAEADADLLGPIETGPLAGEDPVVAAAQELFEADGRAVLDRLAVYAPEGRATGSADPARRRLAAAQAAGFERLLAEHRAAWGARWEDADVALVGDPELGRAVRFALFHLMSSVPDTGEAAMGARGLSGPAYRGHVFWDADVFVLPFLAATHPAAARAMLEYRLRRLPAARAAAAAAGYEGARFPWESANTGSDVTPRSARDPTGRAIAIRTGDQEEHIVADVAWAAACYADWTGDAEFERGPGRLLLVETARYWASRIRIDEGGRGHIDGVIGPDEYHEQVDDNAFTNVMARWNLRRAADAAGRDLEGVAAEEPETWLRLADALVDGYDAATGLYEQFEGFFDLEPLLIADVAPRRPVSAEALLGHERLSSAQVVKQADVLMLHHLVPDEVAPSSLEPNLDFYEPRTAHGSSLSPGIHAALFASAGRLDQAVRALSLASRIDLADLTGTTAGGLHLAAMGSVWQALAFGFAGLRPRCEVLELAPRLPPAWRTLELRVRFRGSRLRIRIESDLVAVAADPPARIRVEGEEVLAGPGEIRVPRQGEARR